jgi:hypothetical protein
VGVEASRREIQGHALLPEDHPRPGEYVVQTDTGQETLSPEEFRKKYGWKNDPERVRLDEAGEPASQRRNPAVKAVILVTGNRSATSTSKRRKWHWLICYTSSMQS